MTHSHSHSHLGAVAHKATTRLALSLGLTLLFVVVEALAGWLSNSLVLLTDAAHNLTDVIALALSWYAMRLTVQPPNPRQTYGYHRAGILVALVNSTTLVLISLGIFYEAWHRFLSPPEVQTFCLLASLLCWSTWRLPCWSGRAASMISTCALPLCT
jgi:cobalt-zinc-cadmium efflux system protein